MKYFRNKKFEIRKSQTINKTILSTVIPDSTRIFKPYLKVTIEVFTSDIFINCLCYNDMLDIFIEIPQMKINNFTQKNKSISFILEQVNVKKILLIIALHPALHPGSRCSFEFTSRVNLSGPSLYCIALTLV